MQKKVPEFIAGPDSMPCFDSEALGQSCNAGAPSLRTSQHFREGATRSGACHLVKASLVLFNMEYGEDRLMALVKDPAA